MTNFVKFYIFLSENSKKNTRYIIEENKNLFQAIR